MKHKNSIKAIVILILLLLTIGNYTLTQAQEGQPSPATNVDPAPVLDNEQDTNPLPATNTEAMHHALALEEALLNEDWDKVDILLAQQPNEQVSAAIQASQTINANNNDQNFVDLVGINGASCSYSNITDAIAAATGGDTIYITAGTYNEQLGSINKSLTFLPATSNCTTVDPAATSSTVIIDATGLPSTIFGGIAFILNNSTVIFRHMTFQNGNATHGGALYIASASVALDNVDIQESTATIFGGGIRLDTSFLQMYGGSRIISNTAQFGGGVAASHGAITMLDSSRIGDSALGNTAMLDGGGIYMADSDLTMNDTTRVRTNTTTDNGGGVYADGISRIGMNDQSSIGWSSAPGGNSAHVGAGVFLTGTAAITATGESLIQYNSTTGGPGAYGGGIAAFGNSAVTMDGAVAVENNSASTRGGGIYLHEAGDEPTLLLKNGVTVQNNDGGGIWARGAASFILDNVSITDNTANYAGGIYLIWTVATATDITVTGNEANIDGGGIYVDYQSDLTLTDSIVDNNTASTGAGIYVEDAATLQIYGTCSISNNTATTTGGGIHIEGNNNAALLSIRPIAEHCSISGNTATTGAGIYAEKTELDLYGNIEINGNMASGNGGGLYMVGNTAWIDDYNDIRPTFLLNSAVNGGGLYLLDVTDAGSQFLDGVDIKGNTASNNGGGIYADNATFTMKNSILLGNDATNKGGGMFTTNNVNITILADEVAPAFVEGKELFATGCDPVTLPADTYCSEFRSNTANLGGAIYLNFGGTITASDTAFMGNSSDIQSSAIHANGSANLSVQNSRISDNTSTSDAIRFTGSGTFDLYQTTIANNMGGASVINIPNAAATVNFSSNVIWGNTDGVSSAPTIGGAGCNISQNGVGGVMSDPLFTTTTRGMYHLGSGSPAINACIGGISSDLDNIARPNNGLYDMGAFEACGVATIDITVDGDDVDLDWSNPIAQTVYKSTQPYQLGGSAGDYTNSYTHFGGALAGGIATYYYVGCANSPAVGAFNFSITPGS